MDMETTNSDNFSVPIDRSVLDRLPDLDDFGDSDCDSASEAEYSYGDDDNDSFTFDELNDEDIISVGSGDVFESSLFTIAEETEEDLMSVNSFDENDTNDDFLDMNSRIQMPRPVSLQAYLAKDGRRIKSNGIDVTYHPGDQDIDTDESESSHGEENLVRKRESLNSFESQSDDDDDGDARSIDSSSTSGSLSFRVAQRRLQKEFSLRKLKYAVQAADLTSSFRKDDAKTSQCIGSIEQTLLQAPENSRYSEGHQAAMANLLNAIASSKAVLTISKE